jgi:ADP-ribosylglycohydrolase
MCPALAMATIPTSDQFTGCLLGLALGDALGAPVEAYPPEEARRYVALLTEHTAPDRGPGGRAFGQVTDDTQLARELLLSIAEQGGFDPVAFAGRLLEFVASGRLVGGGPATLAAARQLAQGRAWHDAGVPAPYAGNGAAMRAGPLGLLYHRDPRHLTRVVVDQARVTHHDPRATAGAVAIAWAVAIASRREAIHAAEFLAEISAAVEPVDTGFATTIHDLRFWVGLAPTEAATAFAERGLEPEAHTGWHGISSFVVSSVCWSLYAFLRAPERFLDAVRVAIEVGGDTDTLAAMTGAISGARLGGGSLPPVLLGRINDAGAWPAVELAGLARRVHQLASLRRTDPLE